MSRTSNAAVRCVTVLIAATALVGQAAQAGVIILENHLPVAASCVVRSLFGDPFGNQRDNPVYEDELFDVRLLPTTSFLQEVPIGQWPVQVRLGTLGIPYSTSLYFIKLDMKCHVARPGAMGHDYVATFVNPDYWPSEGDDDVEERLVDDGDESLRSGGSTFRIDPPRRVGTYKLDTYTPTDHTRFVLRLRPAADAATATQALADAGADAPPAIELGAMPLLSDGSPLRAAMLPLGSFTMVAAPDDDGEPSSYRAVSRNSLSEPGADDSHQLHD